MDVLKIFRAAREWICLVALLTATSCFAQSDPGPRGGSAGAGAPIGGLTPGELDLFTIAGRPDTPAGCSIQQPDFAGQQANHNVIFRIPTPTFGAGLIEAITDTTIRNNLVSNSSVKANNGIRGHVNTNGNDGTVTRFGWKAQNKSLLIFAGEAYTVEMGVTNEAFPNEREEDPACATNNLAEDSTGFADNKVSDLVAFTAFMRFLDQPTPAACGVGGQPACS